MTDDDSAPTAASEAGGDAITELPIADSPACGQAAGAVELAWSAGGDLLPYDEAPQRRSWGSVWMWGAVFGLSMALGPVLGGALVDSIGWRSVFFVNVPIGAVALVLTAALVPESRAEHPRRLDPVGQLLVIAALASLTYAIIEAPRAGWTSPGIVALFAFSLASFVGLVLYELRRREPLVEMRFFRSAPFSGASTIAICAFLPELMNCLVPLNTKQLPWRRARVRMAAASDPPCG